MNSVKEVLNIEELFRIANLTSAEASGKQFKKIPKIGNLVYEQVLLDLSGCPGFFTCRNEERDLFLCFAYEEGFVRNWCVIRCEEKEVLKMIDQKQTIYNTLKSGSAATLVREDYINSQIISIHLDTCDIEESILPYPEDFLDVEDVEVFRYGLQLREKMEREKFFVEHTVLLLMEKYAKQMNDLYNQDNPEYKKYQQKYDELLRFRKGKGGNRNGR